MYRYCKLCGECMLLAQREYVGEWTSADRLDHFKCHFCSEYTALFSIKHNRLIEEKLYVKSLKAVFHNRTDFNYLHVYKRLPNHKGDLFMHVFHIGECPNNELTHELVVQWVKKLANFPLAFM